MSAREPHAQPEGEGRAPSFSQAETHEAAEALEIAEGHAVAEAHTTAEAHGTAETHRTAEAHGTAETHGTAEAHGRAGECIVRKGESPAGQSRWLRPYSLLFRTVLKRMDPETAHHLAFSVIRALPLLGGLARRCCKPHPSLRVRALGLEFPSPFGLAAGFDKNAAGILGLGELGFGHVEVGTVTRHPQPGNPKPRMYRLVEDRGLINRMGFNNEGSAAAVPRIEQARLRRFRPVIGANIGKSRITEVEDATDDYVWSAERLAPIADYLAVNVSSPNTPGLRGLQELELLEPLLAAVKQAAGETPLLVKIAPDMSDDQIDGIVALAVDLGLDGIIATNTTISRDGLATSATEVEAMGAGGLSGAPLAERSLDVLRRIRQTAPTDFCVIAVGGVTTPEDVLERLDAGATLVQGFTAFIYEGPLWARQINRGLRKAGWRQQTR